MALMTLVSADGEGPLRKGLSSFAFFPLNDITSADVSTIVAKIEKDISALRSTPGIHPGLREQIDIQLESLHSKQSPEIEISSLPMLFSSKHMDILIQGIKYIRTMAQTEPMKSAYVGEELQPGSLYTSDEELEGTRQPSRPLHPTQGRLPIRLYQGYAGNELAYGLGPATDIPDDSFLFR
ncbi:hypothetical protein C0993_008723 [Termitomyces sp. T159_Od127]|nr:hypothetical protein C0993_008723 [Termitomyces sp. T159_Od127]